jgi:[acyl-carrier-protein] S-malonyltransferase
MGIQPQYTAGHSLGEYTALVAAGAMKFAEAVRAVQKRGRFMKEAVPFGTGAMKAIMNLERAKIEEICREVSTPTEVVVPANFNTEEQIVVSGHVAAVERAGARCEAEGATVRALNVSAPFHSPLMQLAAEKMNTELSQLSFQPMSWPVISNVTAKPYSTTEGLVENLTKQISSPVRWHETMQFLNKHGITRTIEMGPKNVLQNMIKRSFPSISVMLLETKAHLDQLTTVLPCNDYTKLVTKCSATIVCTRNRNWDNDLYQKGVVEPYKRLQAMQTDLEQASRTATPEEAQEALRILKQVFDTKLVPENEQQERFNEVLDATGTTREFAGFVETLILSVAV